MKITRKTAEMSSTFCQMVAHEVARDGFLDRHVKRIREVYGEVMERPEPS